MNKITIFITAGLIILSGIVMLWLSNTTTITLKDNELVSAYISIAACLGALISATFVIFSYIQTNNSYVESQRPHLLAMLENCRNNNNESVSRIHYRNITNNRFNDLTINLGVTACNRSYDLSHLFRPDMTMIGLDQRQRTFNPTIELHKIGLNLQETASSGNEVILKISYHYTFNKIADHVDAQQYRWDANSQEWIIC